MSRVSSGEVKQNPLTGNITIYPGKPNNNDSLIDSSVNPGDLNRIYSNNFPWINEVRQIGSTQQKQQNLTKKYGSFSSLAKQTAKTQANVVNSALQPYADMQDAMAQNNIGSYATGKSQNQLGIPGWARAIPTAASMLAGINQLNWWKRQDISAPDIYASNPNEGRALSVLAGLRDNPTAQLRAMQDAERRMVGNTNGMGGLSGSQRYLANVAGAIGLQRNYADVLNRSNAQTNQYKANYASSALQAGQADAARRMEANQFGYNAYTAAHGRKVKGIETGIANIINGINNGFSNEFKYRTANRTLDMYQQSIDADKAKLLSEYNVPIYNPSTRIPIYTNRSTPSIATPTYTKIGSRYVFNTPTFNINQDYINPYKRLSLV